MRLFQRASATGTPLKFSLVSLASLTLFCCANLHADILQYTFTGQIPLDPSENTHSEIANGESWIANFWVDTSTPDDDPSDPAQGSYLGAVVGGSLTFSGGYISPLEFASYDLFVSDDLDLSAFGIPIIDTIQVSDPMTSSENLVAFVTEDLSTLTSDAFPGPGFAASQDLPSFPTTSGLSPAEFFYTDINGEIRSGTNQFNNIEFSASAIPEPGSFVAVLLMTMAVTMRRRK